MKKAFKLIGVTLILVIALALFLIGPLYYLPIAVKPESDSQTEQVETLPEETEPEISVEGESGEQPAEQQELLGNIIIKSIKAEALVEKMGLGLFTSVISTFGGALAVTWLALFIVILRAKKNESNEKPVKSKKKPNKNKKVEGVVVGEDSIKHKIPEPISAQDSAAKPHHSDKIQF